MSTERPTVDMWRSELERVMQRAGDEGMTAVEIATSLGVSTRTLQGRLSLLHKAGRLAYGKRMEKCYDGISRPKTVYWIKSAAEPK